MGAAIFSSGAVGGFIFIHLSLSIFLLKFNVCDSFVTMSINYFIVLYEQQCFILLIGHFESPTQIGNSGKKYSCLTLLLVVVQ